ncbi:hypothetical protein LGN12_12265 [Burkholderia multivorans]|nr:hypothetical protein [Burkholderia multivorans]
MKKFLIAVLFAPLVALAQTYPSPTFNSVTLINPLTIANGGTGTTTSTGSGSVVLGTSPTITSPTIGGTFTATGLVKMTDLATLAANTVVANATGSIASPTAFAMPTCNSATSALNWVPGSGFSCNSSVTAGAFSGVLPVANGGTGISALGSGVQTGLGASVNSGNGFVTYAQNALSGAGITPYAYGAVGDGVADDTTALQNWLNASAASGLTAFCSAGTYKITASLNLNSNNAYKIAGPGGSACNITSNMPTITVSGAAAGATYSGVPSIRLTVSSTTGIASAAEVTGVNGTTEVNGAWPAVVIDSTHVDFVGPTFAHAWTSGGWVVLPVIALSPPSPGASQPNLDISGVYFGTATNNNLTDAAVFTGPPAGSNVYAHDLVVNGTYRRGFLFYNSFAPIIKNVFFYNMRGAAIVANQDISFSNAVVDHSEFFSNGNTALEPSVIIGGANWVENPTFFNSQWSGNNSGGLNFAGNVFGATIVGNYLENNTAYNFSCTGSGNNGATITGNFFNYNSGTNNTSLAACGGVMFSGNFLVNQSFSFGGNSQIPATNSFSGTSAITYPIVTPSSIVSSTVAAQAITSGSATNVTSVSLSAGNWSCTGSTWTNPAGTTTQSYNVAALSTTSLGFPGSAPGEVIQTASAPGGTSIGQNVGPVYYTLPSQTTLYLVAQVNYATSTLTINGDIHCLRIF